MKAALIFLAFLLIAAAYVGGYWPEHRTLETAQTQLQFAKTQLAQAQDDIRMYQLENHLLDMIDQAGKKNYGQAQKLSTAFFDLVRSEADRTTNPSFKSILESALQKRDAVTTDLAQGNAAVVDRLQQILSDFRQTLGVTPASDGGAS